VTRIKNIKNIYAVDYTTGCGGRRSCRHIWWSPE